MNAPLRILVLALSLALAACGAPPSSDGPDAALPLDPDAGSPVDAGEQLPDAGEELPDAGWEPPQTTIDSGPPALSGSASATFTFSSNEATHTFECSLDEEAFALCTSPATWSGLEDGEHRLEVRALDPAGRADPTPATFGWRIDATPPQTAIDSAPTSEGESVPARFTFSSEDATATFECALDGAAFAPCTSPEDLSGLSPTTHTFEVRAVDEAGNVDPSPASHAWTVSPAGPTVIRIMAANTTSGNYQSYTPGHGTRIFQGLDPDIVLIQEFNYENNTEADIRAFVDLAFGPEFEFSRQDGVQIPNGIISRYPILASGIWDDPQVSNREFNWARIDVPGPKDLWAVSLHLLTSSSSVRNAEANALVSLIQANIPAGDYLVVGGDLNTDNRTEPCISTLSQVVVTSNSISPWPTDQDGNGNTNASRSKPYDWVLADSDLAPLETPMVIGNSTYPNGIVFDSRVYSPLSEVSPVQSGDSSASNMQHMAVAKDFLISP